MIYDLMMAKIGMLRYRLFAFFFVVYEDVKWKTLTQHDVFRDEITSCLSDHARFIIPQGHIPSNLVTTEFARDVCQLPAVYEPTAYRKFIENWGTVSSCQEI